MQDLSYTSKGNSSTFLLSLSPDHPRVRPRWPRILEIVWDWGCQYQIGMEKKELPESTAAGITLTLKSGSHDLLSAWAALHSRLYDLPVNLEIEKT